MKKILLVLFLLTMTGSLLFAVNPILAQGGGLHSLVLTGDNQLFAWGNNAWANLGDNSKTNRDVPTPVYSDGILAGKTIIKIAKGDYFDLVLDDENHLYAWGDNRNGSLGNNSPEDLSHIPVAVDMTGVLAGKTITDIAAGAYHALVVDSDGKLYAWGDNYRGQLGNHSNTDAPLPIEISIDGLLAGKTITSVAAGQMFSMALDSDGKVYTWGANNEGQLGTNTYTNCNYPVSVFDTGVLNGKIISSINAGKEHAFALDTEGQAYAWGNNQDGQLGDVSNSDRRIPVKVYMQDINTEGQYLIAISAGASHSAAIDSDGKAYTWGNNWSSALGINSDIASANKPMAVYTDGLLSGKTIEQISAVYFNTFVMDSEGNLYSWGDNRWGMLGDNTETTRELAVSVVNNDNSQFNVGTPDTPLPITLTSFTATAKAGFIELSWETASETNNASFLIYRNGKALAKIDGAGTTTETNNYVYTDATVVPGVAYTYVLADIDYANNETKHENDAVTVMLANDVVEADFVIGAAYPNPFNPTAVIPVNLTREAVVNAKIYTLTGREIATITNGTMNAGSHNLRISADNMTTGLYLVKIVVENIVDVQKIAFVK